MAEDKPKGKPVDRSIPDPEVKTEQPQTKTRRYLTAKYKLQVLKDAEECKEDSGEIGALLRREGLYSSHLSAWRRERDEGRLSATSEIKRGRRRNLSEVEEENLQLRAENEGLKLKYDQAQKIIEAQKKIAEILDLERQEKRVPGDRRGKL
jgi:transposase